MKCTVCNKYTARPVFRGRPHGKRIVICVWCWRGSIEKSLMKGKKDGQEEHGGHDQAAKFPDSGV